MSDSVAPKLQSQLRNVFLLLSGLNRLGLARGAVALSNSLAKRTRVTLITLKASPWDAAALLHDNVTRVDLSDRWGALAKLKAIRTLADDADTTPVLISMGFSADLIALLLKERVHVMSCVRGNLLRNYRYDYGAMGRLLALLHYRALRLMPAVIAISRTMASQLAELGIANVKFVGNFIDEEAISRRRSLAPLSPSAPGYRLIYVGQLSRRKRVDVALEAVHKVASEGLYVRLDIVGDGPLRSDLELQARTLGIEEHVVFWGELDDPTGLLLEADLFLLPSESEGVSRAAMEALYLGLPCILRSTVEAATELIVPGYNGALFEHDGDLPKVMRDVLTQMPARRRPTEAILLPAAFREHESRRLLMEIIENV